VTNVLQNYFLKLGDFFTQKKESIVKEYILFCFSHFDELFPPGKKTDVQEKTQRFLINEMIHIY